MESTVTARPNHYETLGLTPAATSEEIARAYLVEMTAIRPRAFGGLAELSIAYETLRDPARRRAYDEALGIIPKSEPRASRPAPKEFKPFMMRASAHPAGQAHAAEIARPGSTAEAPDELSSEQRIEEPHEPGARIDPAIESIAARLRELAKPVTLAEPPAETSHPQTAPWPERKPDAAIEPVIEEILAVGRAEKERLHDVESAPIDWKKVGLAVGSLILGAGLLGAWAGLDAGKAVDAQQPEKATTLSIPPARLAPATAATPSPVEVPVIAEAKPERRRPAVAPRPRVEHPRQPLQINLAEEQQPLADPVDPSQLPEIAIDRPAAERAATPAPTNAAMPLSNATIARTIGRIGYPCGRVASTTAVEGDTGSFTVTCTSGHSYRAAPVRGRYHFRRLANH